jgi:hypothetical protein
MFFIPGPGAVKSEDVKRFPPWGYKNEKQTIYNQPTYYSTMTGLPKRMAYPGAYENQYHEHAKNGFKYWQEQKRAHSPSMYSNFIKVLIVPVTANKMVLIFYCS